MKLTYSLDDLLRLEDATGEYEYEISDDEFEDAAWGYFKTGNNDFNKGADNVLSYLQEADLMEALLEALEEDDEFIRQLHDEFEGKAREQCLEDLEE